MIKLIIGKREEPNVSQNALKWLAGKDHTNSPFSVIQGQNGPLAVALDLDEQIKQMELF